MAEIIGQLINSRYRVDAFLGKGAMAEVYKVWDMERNVHLAMKILHADLAEDRVFLRRFKREADTLSTLQHPNIVRFYGMERDGYLVYMLMDYIDGVTLRKEIFQKEEPFSLERILDVMRSVCSALYYAHKLGFVHCDVKPANIMIQNNGTVLVADFGISRMTEASTATMVGAGTPAYMSPEQIKGNDPAPQMDIYALGVVLFEMLTGGERPFTGDNAKTTGTNSEKVRWEQLKLPAPPPSKYNLTITPDIDALVLKCLDKNPESRYQDAMDLYRDLLATDSVSDIDKIPMQEQQPEKDPISDSTKPVSLSNGGNKEIKALKDKKIIIGIGLVIIGALCVLMMAGSTIAISSYQNSVRVTGTAQALNMNSTMTRQAAFLYATATKQEQNARATATKQSALELELTATQSYEATVAVLQFNEISDIIPFSQFEISVGVNGDCSGDHVGEIFSQEDLFKNDWGLYIFWPSNLSLSQYSPRLSLFSEKDEYLINKEDLDLRLDDNSCAWHYLWFDRVEPGMYTIEIISNGDAVYRKNILITYSNLAAVPRPERLPLGQFTIGRYGVDNESCTVNSPVVSVLVSELKDDEWFYFTSPFQLQDVGLVVTWSLYYDDTVQLYYQEERAVVDDIDLCFWQGFSLDGASPGKYTLEIEVSGSDSKKYEFVFYVKQ